MDELLQAISRSEVISNGVILGPDLPAMSPCFRKITSARVNTRSIELGIKSVEACATSPATPFVGETVGLDGTTSSDPDGSILNYLWSFGDGTTGSGAVTSPVYIAPGVYPLSLVVSDNRGNTASTGSSVTVASISGAHASLSKWKGNAQIHHESLSKDPTNTFQAHGTNDGNRTVWVYAKSNVTVDVGVTLVAYTSIVQLSPRQSIDGKASSSFSASFTPPLPGNYVVTTTIFYSANSAQPPIGDPSFHPDPSSSKTFTFSATH